MIYALKRRARAPRAGLSRRVLSCRLGGWSGRAGRYAAGYWVATVTRRARTLAFAPRAGVQAGRGPPRAGRRAVV